MLIFFQSQVCSSTDYISCRLTSHNKKTQSKIALTRSVKVKAPRKLIVPSSFSRQFFIHETRRRHCRSKKKNRHAKNERLYLFWAVSLLALWSKFHRVLRVTLNNSSDVRHSNVSDFSRQNYQSIVRSDTKWMYELMLNSSFLDI